MRILLSRRDCFRVLAITDVTILAAGSIWVEAMADKEDLILLKNSRFKYTVL